MNRPTTPSLAAAALTAGAVLGTAPATAEDVDITIVAGHPPVFRWVRMIDESFLPALDERLAGTGHTISATGQYGGAIAGVGEELETVGGGLAEIGICQSLFDPSALPLQNVTYYTPFVSDDAATVARVMDDLQREDERMARGWGDNDTVYLGAPVVVDDYLLMTTFPVASLDDLDGKKIAAPGAAINWLSGTGAIGVSGNLTTYYNELKTNVYDGVIVFASAALPGKLHEVAPYITRAGLGAQFAGGLCANADWYEALPAEVREALVGAAVDATAWYLDDLSAAVETAFETMGEAGATITEASDEMRRSWAEGMDDAARAWADELEARGVPAAAVLGDYMDAMREAGAKPVRDWDAR